MTQWISQLRRGVLEYGILLLIAQRPRYGYDLISSLRQWEPLAVTEGTLYPLLRRLEKDGVIHSYWNQSESGPPRKFYRLTPVGERLIGEMNEDWRRMAEAVASLQREGNQPI